MTPLAFLGLAAAITLLGSLFLVISGRKKTPWESSINSFRKRLEAIAPPEHQTADPSGDMWTPGDRGRSAGT
ncbi:MAG: hypothetical protein QF637_07025 [Acidimicrobiales bacterium]|nr:hypothetical protein [Acidimicrobiales bacterium]